MAQPLDRRHSDLILGYGWWTEVVAMEMYTSLASNDANPRIQTSNALSKSQDQVRHLNFHLTAPFTISISTSPTTMRAWNFSSSGPPSRILSLNSSCPAPSSPTGSNLVVRVSYAGLTSAGVTLMRDVPSILRRAAIPDMDFSGHIALAGPTASSEFAPGMKVFGTVNPTSGVLSGNGALADYVLVPSDLVQVVPSNLRLEEAATLGALAQTGLKMVETADVANGHWILIHGASGGVGIVATQIAKVKGATVVATCSKRNIDMVKAAGADEVIDYTAHGSFHEYLKTRYEGRSFDSILDTAGLQDLYVQSPAYLKPQGIYVNVGTLEDKSPSRSIWRWVKNSSIPSFLGGTPRKFAMFGASVTADGVKKLAEYAENGCLQVFIDSVFKMEDVLAGYERLQSRHVKGRVVIKVRSSDDEDSS